MVPNIVLSNRSYSKSVPKFIYPVFSSCVFVKYFWPFRPLLGISHIFPNSTIHSWPFKAITKWTTQRWPWPFRGSWLAEPMVRIISPGKRSTGSSIRDGLGEVKFVRMVIVQSTWMALILPVITWHHDNHNYYFGVISLKQWTPPTGQKSPVVHVSDDLQNRLLSHSTSAQ